MTFEILAASGHQARYVAVLQADSGSPRLDGWVSVGPDLYLSPALAEWRAAVEDAIASHMPRRAPRQQLEDAREVGQAFGIDPSLWYSADGVLVTAASAYGQNRYTYLDGRVYEAVFGATCPDDGMCQAGNFWTCDPRTQLLASVLDE